MQDKMVISHRDDRMLTAGCPASNTKYEDCLSSYPKEYCVLMKYYVELCFVSYLTLCLTQ